MSRIGDGPAGGGTDESRPLVDPFEDGTLDVPNCPACLTPMEAAGTPSGAVYWACPSCGQTRLA